MTASNKELAARAREIMQHSDGLAKTAARCVQVAVAYSPSVRVARESLAELERPDVRQAALELLDQLASGSSNAPGLRT